MELHHLRYFLAVIDAGSVNAAASSVGVAQPTISQAARTLERELGTPLFYRIGRDMVPTSAGRVLVGPARHVLRDVATAEDSISSVDGTLRGRLNIRAHPALSVGTLARLVAEYRRLHPKVLVTIGSLDDEASVADLLRNAVCEIVVTFFPCDPTAEQATGDGQLDVVELGTLSGAKYGPVL